MIFQLWTGWSGTSLFEQWTLAVYSIFFSSLPVLAVGVFERDLNKTTLLAVPDLYKSGIVNASFNVRTFLRWTIQGIYHAFMAVLIPVILFQGFASSAVADGASNNNNWSDIISNLPKYVFPTVFFSNLDGPLGESGLYPLGTIVYTLVVFIVTIKIAYIESRTYTIFTHLFVFISLSIWFLYQFAYSRIVAWLNSRLNTGGGPDMGFDAIGLDYQFFNSQPLLWLIILFVCTLTLILCDFTFYAWLRIGNKWDKIFRYLSRHHDAGSLETSSSGSGGGNGARALSTSTNSLNIASSSGHNRSESLKNTQANLAKIALAEWRRLKLRYRDWALLIPWWQKWEAENEVHPDGF